MKPKTPIRVFFHIAEGIKIIMQEYAKVYVDVSHLDVDRPFDYKIPPHLLEKMKVGMRVLVPFGKGSKLIEGYVVKLHSTPEFDEKKIKSIHTIIDEESIFSYSMLQLAYWMKKEYMCTFVEALQCIMPTGIKTKHTTIITLDKNFTRNTEGFESEDGTIQKLLLLLEKQGEISLEDLEEEFEQDIGACLKLLKKKKIIQIIQKPYQKNFKKILKCAYLLKEDAEVLQEIELLRKKNAHAQIRILTLLMDQAEIPVLEIKKFLNVSQNSVNQLIEKKLIGMKSIDIQRNIDYNKEYTPTFPMKLTFQQRQVYNKILELLHQPHSKPILLHGVTGSGKTEIYLQIIQRILEQNKQAIMLVPEISLTPQMVDRFKSRFGNQVAVLHSRLSLGERFDQWQAIKKGKVSIAVGARSAVFSPFSNLGLIIIDEEHESSYKSEMKPKYHAIEVAEKRCELENAVLLLGSATPSLETYYKTQNEGIELLELMERVEDRPLPEVEIIDMKKELQNGNKTMFSQVLHHEIEKNLMNKQQIILFLNKRGYSSFVSCRRCGYVARCPKCDISLTYHKSNHMLKCHYCDYKITHPKKCPVCKDEKYIKYFGTGTQKVEQEIQKVFPNASLLRMDLDTTSKKNAHEQILSAFQQGKADILIGTQMIAKGLDFPNVTLVGVIAADMSLHVEDFRASERTFQLLTQVAGRAGRGKIHGRVIIQTYTPEHYSIIAAQHHDYHQFYNQEITVRKNLDYCPYTNIFYILVSGSNENKVIQSSHRLTQYIHFYNHERRLEILGPTPAALSKIQNKYRWKIIIKCKNKEYLRKFMKKCLDIFVHKELDEDVQIGTDINPMSMY